MSGSIICGVDDSKSAKSAAHVARGLSAELGMPPSDGTAAATNGHHVGHAGTEFEDGIARFRFGSLSEDERTDFAGGIARFSLGSRGGGV